MGKVDLHIHTTASDGKFTPAEIVRKALASGLVYIAICDHDSIEALSRPRKPPGMPPGITVIGGVEINTDIPAGELHILGYFFDCDNQELKTTLERLRNSRIERAKKMIDKLRSLGIKIDYRTSQRAGRDRFHRTAAYRAGHAGKRLYQYIQRSFQSNISAGVVRPMSKEIKSPRLRPPN